MKRPDSIQRCGSRQVMFSLARGLIRSAVMLTAVMICGLLQMTVSQGQAVDSSDADAEAAPEKSRSLLIRTPPGLVYFVGSIERLSGRAAIVDLGEVHSLKESSLVSVFRSSDSQMTPMGLMEVANSFPSWIQTEPVLGFEPQIGDLVLFIRPIGEIGTGQAHQDRFLARRKIMDKDRNGYRTIRDAAAAEALLDIRLQQPKWFQYEKRISGVVAGKSVRKPLPGQFVRLLQQINLFRALQEEGYPVAAAAGGQWNTVMQLLQGPPPEREIVLTNRPDTTAPSQFGAHDVPLVEIQVTVDRIMFDRTREERAIASALCTAMLKGISRNEPEWLRVELGKTQFPQLADDLQFRSDAISIVRQLRERQQAQP